MTGPEGRAWLRELVTEPDTAIVTDAVIDQYIDRGQEALNDVIGYSWKDDNATIALVAGTQEYSLPADFVEPVWASWNNEFLKEFTQEELRSNYQNWVTTAADGTVTDYCVYGRKIILYRVPNVVAVGVNSTVKLRYICSPTAYTTTAFDGLATEHHAIPIFYAAALWMKAHGFDATFARATQFTDEFQRRAEGAKQDYLGRRTRGKGK